MEERMAGVARALVVVRMRAAHASARDRFDSLQVVSAVREIAALWGLVLPVVPRVPVFCPAEEWRAAVDEIMAFAAVYTNVEGLNALANALGRLAGKPAVELVPVAVLGAGGAN